MRFLIVSASALMAGPAFAADGPFFTFKNTDFVVLVGFLVFVGILLYFGVPGKIGKLLDGRAEGIRNDLEEARRLREEAQELYASYERRQREVQTQADEIVANAKREADANAVKAQKDLELSIERRIAAAEEQIAAAEADAVRAIRNRAITAAVDATGALLSGNRDAASVSASIDASIDEVAARLH